MWNAPQASATSPSSTSAAPAVDGAGDLGAVLRRPGRGRRRGRARRTGRGRRCRCRDRALVAHPGDGHRRVEAAGERDADAFAQGQRRSGPCVTWWEPSVRGLGCRASLRGCRSQGSVSWARRAARPQPPRAARSGGVPGERRDRFGAGQAVAGDRPGRCRRRRWCRSRRPGSAWSSAEARNCAAPGGVRSTARLRATPRRDSSSSPQQPGEPRSRRSRGRPRACGRRPPGTA